MLIFFTCVLCSVISFFAGAATVAYGTELIKKAEAEKIAEDFKNKME